MTEAEKLAAMEDGGEYIPMSQPVTQQAPVNVFVGSDSSKAVKNQNRIEAGKRAAEAAAVAREKKASVLSKLFPGHGEQVHVYRRRDEDGKLIWVGQYTEQAVKGFTNMEAFLAKFVAPKFPGCIDYEVVLIGPEGVERQRSAFCIEVAGEVGVNGRSASPEGILADALQEIAKHKAQSAGVASSDLVGLLRQLSNQGQGQGNADSNTAALLDRIARMEQESKSEKDRAFEMNLMAKLMQKIENAQAPAPMPMPVGPSADDVVDKVMQRLAPMITPKEQFGPREMIELMKTLKPDPVLPAPPQKTIIDQLAELAQLK